MRNGVGFEPTSSELVLLPTELYRPMTTAGFEPATSNGEEQNDRAAAYRGRSLPAVGRALRYHGALETLIWSDTCGLSSCSSTVRRTRSFVLKAQYVKNVFVPGEGSEPAYRQAGLPAPRYGRGAITHPEASGPPTRHALLAVPHDPGIPATLLPACAAHAGIPSHPSQTGNKKPGLADRALQR